MAKKKVQSKNTLPEGWVRISKAASAAAVSTQTVEYYIMLGLVTPLRETGRYGRFFDSGLIKRIKLIRRLNETGYALRDIREIYLKGRALRDVKDL
ncbi:MAG: MerR family transcriptional regulator [Phycisphaerae bacterium]|nr:MerR family transcriptional regulator [Phycisphaerae bacterium]